MALDGISNGPNTGIQGQMGPRGRTILTGYRAPQAADGEAGDYYYDKVSFKFYGPRAENTGWDTSDFVEVGFGAAQQVVDQATAAQIAAQNAAVAAQLAQVRTENFAGSAYQSSRDIGTRSDWQGTAIPSTFKSLRTVGFGSSGDNGSGLYRKVTIQPSHTGKFQSADGAWWEYVPEPLVNVKAFGAKGDGTTDDTALIQQAIDFAKATGYKTVYFPRGTYKVTSSLNVVGNSGAALIVFKGDGRFSSIIEHLFPIGEAYPVLDMCGNGRGGLEDISIRPSAAGTSYATCAVLWAKGLVGGSAGNTQYALRCTLQAGRIVGDAAVVVYNADLSRLTDCEVIGGGAGLSMGTAKPINVVSKFITIPTQFDWTQGYVERCELLGTLDAGLIFSGGTAICLDNSYVTLIGVGSPYIIIVDDPFGSAGNTVIANGLRTENQSSATNVTALHFKNPSRNGSIDGALDSGTSGYMIGSDADAGIAGYTFNISGNGPNLFNLQGVISDCDIIATVSHLGNVVSTSGCYNLRFAGLTSATEILAGFGSTQGLRVSQAQTTLESLARSMFHPGIITKRGRQVAVFEDFDVASAAYTGGSGEVSLLTRTIPIGLMKDLFTGQLPASGMELKLWGRINSAWAAGGRFRIQLTQGSNSTNLLDWNNGPPAGNTPGGGLKIEIELSRTGTSQLVHCTEVHWCGSIFVAPMNYLGANFLTTGADMTLDFFVTNTGSTPLNILRSKMMV